MSIFDMDCEKPYKIKKPIRLIELFAGIGSQAKALQNIGADFEHYRICEFDKYAVQSYNAVHGTKFMPSDITKLKAEDLGIVETDKYDYIMTYSFPCTDLSVAGKCAGMGRDSGTRSGLLWEVERLLKECKELPQVLLMENVPQVHGKKNIDSFNEWCAFLENKGYKNYWQDLNAKNYGIPQNRNRTFMVSLLGDYFYEFPGKIPLKLRLKDMLEEKVDEKYYIKNAKANTLLKGLDYENADKVCCDMTINQPRFRDIANTIKARYDCGIENQRQTGRAVIEPIIVDDLYNNREPREYRDTAPTLRIGGGRLKVVEPIPNERFFRQAIETANENEGNSVNLEQSNIKNINSENGLFTTLGTNCGSSTSAGGGVVLVKENLKTQLCNKLKGAELEHCPSITTSCWESNNLLKEPITVDTDIKQCVRKNYEREKEQIAQSDKEIYQCECESGFQDNKVGIKVSPTLRAGNSHTAVYNNYRIRKLTPQESWRLMGFTDSDFDKAKASGVSNSQLYKQAGNSIVVQVLEAIFRNLF